MNKFMGDNAEGAAVANAMLIPAPMPKGEKTLSACNELLGGALIGSRPKRKIKSPRAGKSILHLRKTIIGYPIKSEGQPCEQGEAASKTGCIPSIPQNPKAGKSPVGKKEAERHWEASKETARQLTISGRDLLVKPYDDEYSIVKQPDTEQIFLVKTRRLDITAERQATEDAEERKLDAEHAAKAAQVKASLDPQQIAAVQRILKVYDPEIPSNATLKQELQAKEQSGMSEQHLLKTLQYEAPLGFGMSQEEAVQFVDDMVFTGDIVRWETAGKRKYNAPSVRSESGSKALDKDTQTKVMQLIRSLAGSQNLIPIGKLRQALAGIGYSSTGEQDSLIGDLRRRFLISASGPEGRHGSTPEERATWIRQGAETLAFISLRKSLNGYKVKGEGQPCEQGETAVNTGCIPNNPQMPLAGESPVKEDSSNTDYVTANGLSFHNDIEKFEDSETVSGGTVELKDSGGKIQGTATFDLDNMAQVQAGRFDDIDFSALKQGIYRVRGIEVDDSLKGKGVGAELYLRALNAVGDRPYFYNSQSSSQAVASLKKLAEKGLIEFHQDPRYRDRHFKRITKKGQEYLAELDRSR